MTDNLFDAPDEQRRQRLHSLGWASLGASTATHGTQGAAWWREPGGRIMNETEAFAALEQLESKPKGD